MNEKTTDEKKCPSCGSAKIQFQGMVHGNEAGQLPVANQHKFSCASCEEIFWVETKDKTKKK